MIDARMLLRGLRHPRKAARFVRDETQIRVHDHLSRRLKARHRERLDMVRGQDEFLLVVLDACRYDYFRELFHFYFQGKLEPCYTPARDTFEYVRLMWPDDHDVTYVSGAVPINSTRVQIHEGELNTLYEGYRPSEHIEEIVDVWDTGWEQDLGTVPPEAVTEAALDRDDADRLVAHYFQPHAPYIGEYELLGHTGEENGPNRGKPNDAPIWYEVRLGDMTEEELHQAYRSNLLRALQAVHELVDATRHENIYITADHGEALGEFGVYAHPRERSRATWHPKIHTVPFLDLGDDV